jgi:hypothetical protein
MSPWVAALAVFATIIGLTVSVALLIVYWGTRGLD